MNENFVSFDPWWGGFNNIRISYELATAISVITNRKLIIPPKVYCFFLSDHSNKNSFFDVWKLWDKEKFIKEFNCIDYNDLYEYKSLENSKQYFSNIESFATCITFDQKNNLWGPNAPIGKNQVMTSEISDITDFESFSLNRDIINLNLKEKYIHFPRNLFGHFYYHVYASTKNERNLIKEKIKTGIKFKTEYFEKSKVIKEKIGNYNSIHIRRQDFKTFVNSFYINQEKNLYKILKEKFSASLPLYISTDESDLSFFDNLKSDFRIFFLKDFYPNITMYESIALEQIICSESEIFLGSRCSTFSDYINILRGYNNKLDYHREGTNFNLPKLKYNKYPWQIEPYCWENIHETYWTMEH